MNTYIKFVPNVFLAKCRDEHEKGSIILLQTRHCKVNEHYVHNLIYKEDGYYFYSITRVDGYDNQEHARKKIERLKKLEFSANTKSNNWFDRSNEGKAFLSLGEPIKIGHHSENKHRSLIGRNWRRMGKSVEESRKAEAYKQRQAYWEGMKTIINLSTPESLYFFKVQLEDAKKLHNDLLNGKKREHMYSLEYAAKKANDLDFKYRTAVRLWGNAKTEKIEQ